MIETNLCRCGHDLRVHDPCSRCACPGFASGKPKTYKPRKVDR